MTVEYTTASNQVQTDRESWVSPKRPVAFPVIFFFVLDFVEMEERRESAGTMTGDNCLVLVEEGQRGGHELAPFRKVQRSTRQTNSVKYNKYKDTFTSSQHTTTRSRSNTLCIRTLPLISKRVHVDVAQVTIRKRTRLQ